MKSRRTAIVIGMGLAVLLAAVLAIGWQAFWARPSAEGRAATQAPAPAPSSTGPAALSAVPSAVGDTIARFPSDPPGEIAAASPFHPSAPASLPSGAAARAVPDTWDPGSDSTGSVAVDYSSPDGQTRRYTALMVKENGSWKLFATVEEAK